jgi:hypothetical protein
MGKASEGRAGPIKPNPLASGRIVGSPDNVWFGRAEHRIVRPAAPKVVN